MPSNMSVACNDSSSNSSMSDELKMVVYSSNTERILSLVVFISVLIAALLGQASVIVTIWKTVNLHSQHCVIIVAYCVGDIVVLTAASLMYIWCILAEGIPLLLCRILSVLLYSTVFGQPSHIGYMAYERYMYFCHPMKYDAQFKKRFMALSLGGIYALSNGYIIITEIFIGRDYHSTVMACNLTESGSHTIIQFMMFVFPAVTISVFCSIKIWRQAVKSSVAPAAPQDQGQEQTNPKQQAARALRVILLVSGVFWATLLPPAFARSVYFNIGITWEDLDSRRSYTQSIILRAIYYLYALVSPLVNPFIYYYSRKDLRTGLRRILGIRNAIAPQDQ